MPTPSQVAELRSTLDDVLTLAQRDVTALTRGLRASTPQAATQAIVAEVPIVVQAWGDVASTVANDWYATVRPSGAVSYSPAPAPPAPLEQIEPMLRWAVAPLWQETGTDWDKALADLLSGSSRLVRQGATDTLAGNSWRDPAAGAWVRLPRANACAFCLMLASRGAVYRSAETAGRGRGFHDHCRCSVVPAFKGDDLPDITRELSAEWRRVTAGQANQFEAWKAHIAATRQ